MSPTQRERNVLYINNLKPFLSTIKTLKNFCWGELLAHVQIFTYSKIIKFARNALFNTFRRAADFRKLY